MKLFDKLLKGRQVDKSINKEVMQQPITPVKEEIPEKRKKQFIGVWDSKRLLRELLEITESVKSWKIELYETDSEQTPYKIRCERVVSAINAFKRHKVLRPDSDYILLSLLVTEDNYSEEKMSKIISLIVDLLPEHIKEIYNEKVVKTSLDEDYTSGRLFLFMFLLEYRFETYKLYTYWDKVLETCIGGSIAIHITNKLYDEKIENVNETLDKLLLLLLGDDFNKTFTEKELLEDYDYPNVTDEELHEMELEYC